MENRNLGVIHEKVGPCLVIELLGHWVIELLSHSLVME